MDHQMTFSDMEYSRRKKRTQKEKFLQEMNEIIPWTEWINKIEPYYPKGKRGRPPRGIEVMLRMYLLQIWFNLSDEGLEDAVYEGLRRVPDDGFRRLYDPAAEGTAKAPPRHCVSRSEHAVRGVRQQEKEKLTVGAIPCGCPSRA